MNIRSIVVIFRKPARRLVMSSPLCDQYGSVVDLNIEGVRYYCNESPMMVQPDFLVDTTNDRIVGLTFELTSPTWMNDRCRDMVFGLDPNAIRISGLDSKSTNIKKAATTLEVGWANARHSKRMFAQLDFGLWAFLYSTPNPSLFRHGLTWTPPEGLIIGDLDQLIYPVSLDDGEAGDLIVKPTLSNRAKNGDGAENGDVASS